MTRPNLLVAGVIGHPISHSRSPRLHGHWLKTYGIDGHYVPLDIAPEQLEGSLNTLINMGFRGLNVTIPHKEAALALAHSATDRARRIGSANTLVFDQDGQIHADTTDGYGFLQNLKESVPDHDLSAGPIAILGAGGATRAIIDALIEEGATNIRLSNRTRARADDLAALFGYQVQVYDWDQAAEMLTDCQMLANTTSLGMVDQPALTIDLKHLSPTALVTDLVYTPLTTPLLADARAKGCRTVDGLGMLLHQAVPGFERWFGTRPQVTEGLRQAVLAE